MKVLVADDDPVSLRLVCKALEQLRHEVVAARDGQEAWELYAQGDYPLVITDWMMPRMTGIQLCEAIRAEARDRYSYVVMVTTLSAQEHTLEGFRAGADDYLVKPVNVEQLRTRIEVAARVRGGMDAKVEMTMRRAVEACQQSGEANAGLLESIKSLGDFYRTQRAYTKARAFLRRQMAVTRERGGAPEELERLGEELRTLEGLGDDPS